MMQERYPGAREINELHRKAISEEKETNRVRAANLPLRIIDISSKKIYLLTNIRSFDFVISTLVLSTMSGNITGNVSLAVLGGSLLGSASLEFIKNVKDKRKKEQIIKKSLGNEVIGDEELADGLNHIGDIPLLSEIQSWLKGKEKVGPGDPRALVVLTLSKTQGQSEPEIIKKVLKALITINKDKRKPATITNEVFEKLSFMVGGSGVMVSIVWLINNLFHDSTVTSITNVLDDVPTLFSLVAPPLIKKLSKLVSYPNLVIDFTNNVLNKKSSSKRRIAGK